MSQIAIQINGTTTNVVAALMRIEAEEELIPIFERITATPA
jgi:hypothetical protein